MWRHAAYPCLDVPGTQTGAGHCGGAVWLSSRVLQGQGGDGAVAVQSPFAGDGPGETHTRGLASLSSQSPLDPANASLVLIHQDEDSLTMLPEACLLNDMQGSWIEL